MFPIADENPTRTFPVVTIALILVNVLVFLYEFTLPPELFRIFLNEFSLFPVEITHLSNLSYSRAYHPYAGLLTSMFLHGGLGHLLGNIWFLWIFGDNIEDQFGHFPYLCFYLLTGIIAGLVHVYLNPLSTIPTMGASGAISAVLGAYIVLFPTIRVKTLLILVIFIQVIHVPAILFLGVWFLMQSFGGFAAISEGATTGVAFGAHIGGFVAGVALVFVFTRWRPGPRRFRYESWRMRRF